MNKRGFTLVELLATLVVLGIVMSLAIVGINYSVKNTKKKTEEVFIDTLRDAIGMYFDDTDSIKKDIVDWYNYGQICKDAGTRCIDRYMAGTRISFQNIIDSKYHPIVEADMKNPASGKMCDKDRDIIQIYRDEDQVYYYYISRYDLRSCLLDGASGEDITNLP